jgi:hypothetical protein
MRAVGERPKGARNFFRWLSVATSEARSEATTSEASAEVSTSEATSASCARPARSWWWPARSWWWKSGRWPAPKLLASHQRQASGQRQASAEALASGQRQASGPRHTGPSQPAASLESLTFALLVDAIAKPGQATSAKPAPKL